MNYKFEKAFEEALTSPTFIEVEKNGRPIKIKEFIDSKGREVIIGTYEFNHKLYLIKRANGKCVRFMDMDDLDLYGGLL